MAVVAKWSGDGLAPGTVLVDDMGGTGDTGFYVSSPGSVLVDDSGPRAPRLKLAQIEGQTCYLSWGPSRLGRAFTEGSVRIYCEFTGWSANAFSLIIADVGWIDGWRVDVSGSAGGNPGRVRLRDKANGNLLLKESTQPLPLNTLLRVEAVVSAAGDFSTHVYEGESTTPLFQVSATGLSAPDFDSLRFGNTSGGVLLPTWYLEDVILTDVPEQVGPAEPVADGDWSLWDGTTEHSLTMTGVWDGTSILPLAFDQVV